MDTTYIKSVVIMSLGLRLPGFCNKSAVKKAEPASKPLPVLNHCLDFFERGLDFFEVFSAALIGFEIEGTAKRDDIPEVADVAWLGLGVFGLSTGENMFACLGQLRFDSFGVSVDGFAERFSQKIQFFGNRFDR